MRAYRRGQRRWHDCGIFVKAYRYLKWRPYYLLRAWWLLSWWLLQGAPLMPYFKSRSETIKFLFRGEKALADIEMGNSISAEEFLERLK